MDIELAKALAGGALIGLSATILLLFNGRVTGISGIIDNAFSRASGDRLWRCVFLVGLVLGGCAFFVLNPQQFVLATESSFAGLIRIGAAGLIVGFGVVMGSGCTSGHGVCGISRFSTRSIVATMVFILAGVITVTLLRHLFGVAL